MKYLKEFRIFEEVQSDLLYLKDDEIEALPAFKRMVKFLSDLRESIPKDQRGGRASLGPFIWTGSSLARAKGISVLDLWGSQYPFKFNPKNGSLKYGQETVNKNFELPYRTIDDWNRAVEEADKFHLAVFLGIKMPTLRTFADPKRLKKWIAKEMEDAIEDARRTFGKQRGQTIEGNIEGIAKRLSIIVPHIIDLYKIDKNDTSLADFNKIVIDYLIKKTKADPEGIGDIPEIYRAEVLAKLGYSDDDAKAIKDLHDIGIF
jgi:hypothetical protein